jgi:hypothetical protein
LPLRLPSKPGPNWLFCGNDDGGHTAAILFSMTSTAKRHGLARFAWLRKVLRKLPGLQPASGGRVPDELLAPLLPN